MTISNLIKKSVIFAGLLGLCTPVQGMQWMRRAREAGRAFWRTPVRPSDKAHNFNVGMGGVASAVLGSGILINLITIVNQEKQFQDLPEVDPKVGEYCKNVLAEFGMPKEQVESLKIVNGPFAVYSKHFLVPEKDIAATLQKKMIFERQKHKVLKRYEKKLPKAMRAKLDEIEELVNKKLAWYRGVLAHEYGHAINKDVRKREALALAMPTSFYFGARSGLKGLGKLVGDPVFLNNALMTCIKGAGKLPLVVSATLAGIGTTLSFAKYAEYRADKFAAKKADVQALRAQAEFFKKEGEKNIKLFLENGVLSDEAQVERYRNDPLFRELVYWRMSNPQTGLPDGHHSSCFRAEFFERAAKEKEQTHSEAVDASTEENRMIARLWRPTKV